MCHVRLEEWNISEALVTWLKPFYNITTGMCASEYPTTSMLILVLHEIENKLEYIAKENASNIRNTMDVLSVTLHVQNVPRSLLMVLKATFSS